MRKFLKLPIYILLVLALALGPVLGITVQGAELPTRYDGFSEGIVSSYYHIDREKDSSSVSPPVPRRGNY